ncbi:conserved hypothetical protein [Talaromyces stipitatus ATCC 10500]|uniref:DUF4211 domain-containing protein n=1 Tax=Talaromyces stipitatus (strain ATCC 10500 / CBS 375.48 / QM 6759 / NRRL 1006) TaxID=441959 RepID=B8MKQ7_TALSN|nr:uncharacterized protein TSTA_043770 [Talaromyces stipitatus ATCC 10500]EED14906.1 conserved hypothetical protein [Talaromyces stipitatus ATCC 10500]
MAGAKEKKKQSRLAFTPIEDLPPSPRATESSKSAFTPSRLRYSNPFTGKATVKGQLQLEDYVRDLRSPAAGDKQGALRDNGQGSSDVDVKPRDTASNSERIQNYTASIALDDGSSDDEVIRPSKRRRITGDNANDNEPNQGSRQSSLSPAEELRLREDDDTYADSKMGRRPTKKTQQRRSQRLIASSPMEIKSHRNALKIDLSNLGEPEESDAGELASPGTHRKGRGLCRKRKSPSVVELEDPDDAITSPTPKRQKTNNQVNQKAGDEEEASDEDVVAFTPSRRSSMKSSQKSGDKDDGQKTPKTPKRNSEQDEQDLEEDLEDLRDTVVRERRTRGSAVNSARSNLQKHLETLRRRRAGEKIEEDTSEQELEEEEQEESGPQQQRYDTARLDWGLYFGVPDIVDSDDGSIIEPNDDLDADDSSFVEDDGELGVPVNVPFEFSRHRTKSTRDCFRDVIEWMVHSKLNPAFHRDDDVYQFAFKKVSDEVVGRAGSQLMSSVWNVNFVNTLRARPHLEVTGHPTDVGRSCDACNRSGHPASSDLKFSGKPYSEETLEPLYESDSESNTDDDSDTSDENSNKPDRDREGRILPSEEKHFYLGRTCKSNAVLTHTLIHWRFHLYEWVIDYLNVKEELLSNPQKSLDREKLSAKKRTKYANKVVDRMDEEGEVQRLWTDFHQTLRTVREIKDVRYH